MPSSSLDYRTALIEELNQAGRSLLPVWPITPLVDCITAPGAARSTPLWTLPFDDFSAVRLNGYTSQALGAQVSKTYRLRPLLGLTLGGGILTAYYLQPQYFLLKILLQGAGLLLIQKWLNRERQTFVAQKLLNYVQDCALISKLDHYPMPDEQCNNLLKQRLTYWQSTHLYHLILTQILGGLMMPNIPALQYCWHKIKEIGEGLWIHYQPQGEDSHALSSEEFLTYSTVPILPDLDDPEMLSFIRSGVFFRTLWRQTLSDFGPLRWIAQCYQSMIAQQANLHELVYHLSRAEVYDSAELLEGLKCHAQSMQTSWFDHLTGSPDLKSTYEQLCYMRTIHKLSAEVLYPQMRELYREKPYICLRDRDPETFETIIQLEANFIRQYQRQMGAFEYQIEKVQKDYIALWNGANTGYASLLGKFVYHPFVNEQIAVDSYFSELESQAFRCFPSIKIGVKLMHSLKGTAELLKLTNDLADEVKQFQEKKKEDCMRLKAEDERFIAEEQNKITQFINNEREKMKQFNQALEKRIYTESTSRLQRLEAETAAIREQVLALMQQSPLFNNANPSAEESASALQGQLSLSR